MAAKPCCKANNDEVKRFFVTFNSTNPFYSLQALLRFYSATDLHAIHFIDVFSASLRLMTWSVIKKFMLNLLARDCVLNIFGIEDLPCGNAKLEEAKFKQSFHILY